MAYLSPNYCIASLHKICEYSSCQNAHLTWSSRKNLQKGKRSSGGNNQSINIHTNDILLATRVSVAKIMSEQCIKNLGFSSPFNRLLKNTETVWSSNLLYLDMANPMPVVQYGYVTQGVYYPNTPVEKGQIFWSWNTIQNHTRPIYIYKSFDEILF